MLDTIATVVVAVLGIHIIIKFAFFALPYHRRRALLDKQFGDKPSATTTSDRVLRRRAADVPTRGNVLRDSGRPLASLASVADADRAGRILPRVNMVKVLVVQRV
jgi:hypothetical protein